MCGIQYIFKNIISIIPGGGRRTKSSFKEVHTKGAPLLEVFLKSTGCTGLSQLLCSGISVILGEQSAYAP